MVIDFEAPKKDMPSHLFRNTARRKSNGSKGDKATKSAVVSPQQQAASKTKVEVTSPKNADDTTAKYDQIRSPDHVPAVQFTLECVDDDNSSEMEAVSFITDASSETRIDITEKSPELQSDTKVKNLY